MSEKDSSVSINVSIANKKFPIIAKNQDEEEVYRAASKRINDMISKFQARYGSQADPLDFLYLTAFQHTVALILAEKRNDTAPILEEIARINIKIDTAIQDKL